MGYRRSSDIHTMLYLGDESAPLLRHIWRAVYQDFLRSRNILSVTWPKAKLESWEGIRIETRWAL
jgi:hypothetical protein